MVVVKTGEILGRRGDLDEVGRVPGAAQGDRRIVEEEIDIRRLVRLTRPALLRLLDEAHHGRVALRKGLLVGKIGTRSRRRDKRDEGG